MSESSTLLQIQEYIVQNLLDGDGGDLNPDTPLLKLGVIDSMSLVGLVAHLERTFHVSISEDELKPANLRDLRSMAAMVERLASGG